MQPIGLFQRVLHSIVVGSAVCLNPFGVYRRPFAEIQCARLQCDGIRCPSHFAAECINFINEMPLARTSDGGVAGHVGHSIQADGKQCGVQAEARCRQGGFNAGVSGTDHRNLSF